jgi:acylphosphatase
MEEKTCVHILASGRVQGVNYRWFTLDTAANLGLNGWVRNLPDGRVEAEVEGEKESVNRLIEALRKGPRLAQVTDLDVMEKAYENRYTDFRVR